MVEDITNETDNERMQLLGDGDNRAGNPSTKQTFIPYLVLLSSLLSFALGAGFNLGIAGALTVAQSQRYEISLERASWSVSVHNVCYLMANPLASIMTRLISIRKAQLLGCIISLIGIGLCGFATAHWHIIALFGVVAGIGLSFIRATLFGILPYYFEGRRLDMAIATVFIGFFSGWLIVPAPASYLFSKYGFNLTMLMVAPLMLVHLLGVIFFSQDGQRVEKKNLPEHISLKESLKQVLTDCKVYVYMLSAFTRKFGHAGFFTIYQDYAMRNIGLTLAESGLSGPIYGSTAMAGVVMVTISHALRWQYSKIISLIVSSTLNAVLIIILTVAVGEVPYFLIIGFMGFWHGVLGSNNISFGSDLGGAHNMVLIQGLEAFGNGVGGCFAPPIASYLQESVSIKSGMYVAGISLFGTAVVTCIIGLRQRFESKRHNSKQKLDSNSKN